jgi:hypothetical protein
VKVVTVIVVLDINTGFKVIEKAISISTVHLETT